MNVLGVFVKQPVSGRVKTRLAADVGDDWAARLYAAFVGDLADRFRQRGDARWLCHTPDDDAGRDWFLDVAGDEFRLWPQPEGSLGRRLSEFFRFGFDGGAERVVVIGSDSPTLPDDLVRQAFDLLGGDDCVLGPATDGGYYLIGQSRRTWPVFDEIDWGGPQVLGQTVARIEEAGARLALLPPWYDVDTVADLELLRGHLRGMSAAGVTNASPRTERCLAQFG